MGGSAQRESGESGNGSQPVKASPVPLETKNPSCPGLASGALGKKGSPRGRTPSPAPVPSPSRSGEGVSTPVAWPLPPPPHPSQPGTNRRQPGQCWATSHFVLSPTRAVVTEASHRGTMKAAASRYLRAPVMGSPSHAGGQGGASSGSLGHTGLLTEGLVYVMGMCVCVCARARRGHVALPWLCLTPDVSGP